MSWYDRRVFYRLLECNIVHGGLWRTQATDDAQHIQVFPEELLKYKIGMSLLSIACLAGLDTSGDPLMFHQSQVCLCRPRNCEEPKRFAMV